MALKILNYFEDPEDEEEEEMDFEGEEMDFEGEEMYFEGEEMYFEGEEMYFEREEMDFEEDEIYFDEIEIEKEEIEKGYWSKLRSMLLYERALILRKVTRKRGNFVTSMILYLTMKDYTEPVNLLLKNCVAGRLASAITVQETIQGMPTDINTIVCGMTASVGSFVLLSGDMRLAEPRARVLIERPKFRIKMKSTVKAHRPGHPESMGEFRRIEDYIRRLYVEKTGQSYDIIQQDLKRTRLMSAKEARHYGIIDHIIAADDILLREENRVPVGIEFTSLFID